MVGKYFLINKVFANLYLAKSLIVQLVWYFLVFPIEKIKKILHSNKKEKRGGGDWNYSHKGDGQRTFERI